MPLYPLSDYLILIFLAMVLGVLCFEKETLLALIFTLVWLARLCLAFRKMPSKLNGSLTKTSSNKKASFRWERRFLGS